MGAVSKESQEESESVGVFEETIAHVHARAEPTDMCAEKYCCEIQLDSKLRDGDGELENDLKGSAEVDMIQGGEGETSNVAMLENMNGKTKSGFECSLTAHSATAVTETIPSVIPTTGEHVNQLQVDESSQLDIAKVDECNSDPPTQSNVLPTASILQENLRTELRGRNTVECAVQCSPLPLQNLMSNKSTQTHTITHTDTAVQVTMDGLCSPQDPKCNTATEDCNHIEQTANAHMNGQVMETTDDVCALRTELDSLQNTVIWQALMLRMYGMH